MKKLPYPDGGFVDYYIKKEFPDKYVCYIHPYDWFNNIEVNEYIQKLIKDLEIDWVDFVSEELIFIEFNTWEAMVFYVNNFPEDIGYCLGYSKGQVSTENT